MTPADESRALRERIASSQSTLARRPTDRPEGAGRYLGVVYDGGAMPTVVPAVYLTHPYSASADPEAEGSAVTSSTDTAASVPVVVLGPTVPTVGDVLIAKLIQGFWVAGLGGAAPYILPGYPCTPCNVPLQDLHLSWTYNKVGGGTNTIAVTLTYTAGTPPTWASGLVTLGGFGHPILNAHPTAPCSFVSGGGNSVHQFSVDCDPAHGLRLLHTYFCNSGASTLVAFYLLADSTFSCSPFSGDWPSSQLANDDQGMVLTT